MTESRVRYLCAEYHREEDEETYTFIRIILSDDRWESSVNGFVYKYIGEIKIPEEDFQNCKDSVMVGMINLKIQKVCKMYGSITNEDPRR